MVYVVNYATPFRMMSKIKAKKMHRPNSDYVGNCTDGVSDIACTTKGFPADLKSSCCIIRQ
jgi:hypothetical protein